MGWFENRSIRVKLLGSFAAVCAVMALVGYIGVTTAQGIKGRLDEVNSDLMPGAAALSDAQVNIVQVQRDVRSSILVDDQKEIEALRARVKDDFARVEAALTAYKALHITAAEKQRLADVDSRYTAWREGNERALTEAVKNTPEGDRAATGLALETAAPLATAMNAALHELETLQQRQAADAAQAAGAAFNQAVMMLLAIAGVGIVFALGIGVSMARSMSRSAETVRATVTSLAENCATNLAVALEALARNDLTVAVTPVTPPIARYSRDEVGRTAEAANLLRDRIIATITSYEQARAGLTETVGTIQQVAEGVADASGQLGQAAGQTS
ncbi:MAG: MCP four helix bundle domain-containing protein, partial [Chloroflexi bacterium]|nr:MCP four helix bundle domain-containing protein [Chloroflexota bacterium]